MTEAPTKLSPLQAARALTGYDELAVERKFGTDFDNLRGTMQLRALVFVDHRRSSGDDAKAYDHALGLTVGDLSDQFGEEPDEVMPDEPVTDGGKATSAPA